MKHFLNILFILALTVSGFAQAEPPKAATTSGDYKSSTVEGGADRLFDVNSDSVDMENGSMQWKGKTFNLGNARVMRARFERYLQTPQTSDDVEKYIKILDKIEKILAPNAITPANYYTSQQEAFNLLFEAAQYEMDANNSLTIASQIKKIWTMRAEFRDLNITKNQLEALRKVQEGVVVNRAQKIEEANDDTTAGSTNKLKKTSQGTTELGYRVKDESRTQAEILAKNAEMTALGLKAQIEFQSQMVGFLLQRRYRHCVITSAFYRVLFKGANQNIKVGAKEVKEFFPVSDFVPTLESLDTLAREAMNDVNLGMKTVDDLHKQGEIYASFERLQETYFLGEYEPVVMTFDAVKKREMLDLWRDLRELQRIGDERDLANVEGYVNKVKGRAKDFPGTSILSKVNNAINASNMAVLSAKQGALSGDTAKAESALERAGKIWPQNPQIKEFATQVVNRQDKMGQMIPEFDRLISEAKWRDIFNKKLEFALALSSDKARSDKLRQIVNRVGELDANIQKASVLASQNNPYLAWDVLVEANKTESDDLVLAKTRSDIAPLVSDYARLIGLAEKFEKEGAEAAALNAWLQAQDINPASLACGEAIKRLARIVAGGSNVRATSEVPVPPLTPATTDEVPVPPAR
ncbi:MAG: hypothetical protein JHC77_04000 [Opitutales bacterium]|nr:hypothetical protein [Opitutales bacterium]